MKKTLFYFFAFALIQVFVSYLVWGIWTLVLGESLREFLHQLGTGSFAPTADMLITASGVSSVLTLLLFVRCHWFRATRGNLPRRPWAIMLWCAVLSAGTIVPSMALEELLPDLPNNMEDTFHALMVSPSGYLMVGIFAPVVEEVAFRGAMITALKEKFSGVWIPVLVSALLFALVHANPAQMPHAFLVGILLGWLYCKFDSIIPGVVVHWANNTIAYIVYFLVPATRDGHLIDVFGSTQRIWLGVVFSLMIFGPALYQLIVSRTDNDK